MERDETMGKPVQIEEEEHAALKRVAKQTGRSLKWLAHHAIRRLLEEVEETGQVPGEAVKFQREGEAAAR